MTRTRSPHPGPATAPGTAVVPPRVRRRARALLWRWRFVLAASCLGLAAGATVHALSPAPAPTAPMLVTARSVPAGTELAADDVRVLAVPPDAVPSDALDTADSALGRSPAVALAAGTPLGQSLLVPDDLASAAPPGTVVAAVRLTDPALVRVLGPGSRVDLLAPSAAPDDAAAALVLARRALVLPVPAPAAPSGGGVLGLGTTSTDTAPDLLLVAVTADEAALVSTAAVRSAVTAVLVQ